MNIKSGLEMLELLHARIQVSDIKPRPYDFSFGYNIFLFHTMQVSLVSVILVRSRELHGQPDRNGTTSD